MGNTITRNMSQPTTSAVWGSGANTPLGSSPQSPSPLAGRRVFGHNLPGWQEDADRWQGHFGRFSSVVKPRGFVNYRNRVKDLPEQYQPEVIWHYRERSPLNQAVAQAFANLDAEALSRRGLDEVFMRGAHPDRFESLLRLVRMQELEALRCTPQRIETATTVETHPMNLLHRMACFATERPTPLDLTLSERFGALSKSVALDVPNANGWTVLHFAARVDNTAAMKALVSRRVDLNAINHKGETALMLAAEYASPETVRMLLTRSPSARLAGFAEESLTEGDPGFERFEAPANKVTDINRRSRDTQVSALHIAANRTTPIGRMIVGMLLEHGADISIQDAVGRTPLHHAVANRDIDAVKLLLEGLDKAREAGRNFGRPNWVDFRGETPLKIAVRLREARICEMLLDHGADPHLRGGDDQTPIEAAQAQGASANVVRALREAAKRGNG